MPEGVPAELKMETKLKKRRTLRIFLFTVAAAGFVWFTAPLLLSVNLNIGNVTGIVVSVLLLLYALFLPRVHRALGQWRKRKGMRWLVYGAFVILAFIACLALVESVFMFSAAQRKPQENAVVVVLGCRVYGERASMSLEERLKAALRYLEEHEEAVCIVSGGQGSDEEITEAECMYRYLLEHGIAASRLYKEERSQNTRENLLYSKQLIDENGWEPKIAIVTNEYHMYRAGRIAERFGMEYGAVCGRSAWGMFPTHYVRELYAILYEWLVNPKPAAP